MNTLSTKIEVSTKASPDGKYRFKLSYTWNHALPPLGWLLLHPTTSDEIMDDTTRRCVYRTRDFGYGSAHLFSIFPMVTQNPCHVKTDSVTHRENLVAFKQASDIKDFVLAYGASKLADRNVPHMLDVFAYMHDKNLYQLGETAQGCPKSPLMVTEHAGMSLCT